ncbi:uncharacterized protein LOC111482158 isoform X2 [Cucurbita maxima]|uniref:Uncharacterized protein LOC111482158 isoform X2 n=1 Tax=Cucurbita maxima TaxID=3661 RepID=A0A6J1J2S9_CUCMA|nr:uncharacterized protein LOC111482158 isoform X2 [Cucurbita maxima]
MAITNTNTLCLVSAMDRLWHHQIILSSPHPSPSHLHPTFPFSNFPSSLSSDRIFLDDTSLVSQEDDSNDGDKYKQDGKEEAMEESLTDPEFTMRKKLNKAMSCKSLGELEMEEVKGFMDLGFQFRTENLSPQMVKLVPGLQRFKTRMDKQNLEDDDDDDKKRDIARPYLSEAWTINRPNSPLLTLRMPKVSSTSDMKKRLKSWARTVAIEIQ